MYSVLMILSLTLGATVKDLPDMLSLTESPYVLRLYPGDILITRNLKEEDNTSPGYWNHAAIYIGNDLIVEAQPLPNAVITRNIQTFYNSYPYVAILRYKDQDLGNKASLVAKSSIDTKYKKMASVFRILRSKDRGENCVSVVRRAWSKTLKINLNWKVPDHIYKDDRFQLIHLKGVKPT